MTEILLIRHGETDWNAERRLQGHSDIALNERGIHQAEALGQALRNEPLDAIVASDLARAQQTAQAVAQHHGLSIVLDPGLRERCYGIFEGLTYAEIARLYPEAYSAWQMRNVDAQIPAGARAAESFQQFYRRVLATIFHLGRQHEGRLIALVAHGGVLECAYRAAMGIAIDTPRNFSVLNASINRFTFAEEKLVLTSWGETSHLDTSALDELEQTAV